jgi:hypothetical protein
MSALDRDYAHQLRVFHQIADLYDWTGEQGALLHLTFRAFLADCERKGKTVVGVQYRTMALDTGRTVARVYEYMWELEALGFINCLDQGNGDPANPDAHRVSTWATDDGGLVAKGGHLLDAWREMWAQEQRRDLTIQLEYRGLDLDDLENLDQGMIALFDLFAGGESSPTVEDLLCASRFAEVASLREPSPRNYDYLTYLRLGRSTGNNRSAWYGDWVPPVTRPEPNPRSEPKTTDGPAPIPQPGMPQSCCASSPLDYTTWADCWQENQAGVLGWALARSMVRWGPMVKEGADPEQVLRLLRRFHVVTGAEAARMVGILPGNGARLLKHLQSRGYAERQASGSYRLLFLDMLADGTLITEAHRRRQQVVIRKRQTDSQNRFTGWDLIEGRVREFLPGQRREFIRATDLKAHLSSVYVVQEDEPGSSGAAEGGQL